MPPCGDYAIASVGGCGAYYLNGATTNAQLVAVHREADWRWAITSEDEWYKAAYHENDGVTGNYFDYPTSRNTAPGRDTADASGNNANYYGTPYPIDSPYYTTVAGEFQNSHSPYGTFDQGGNVLEWNEALLSGLFRGLRGGSFYYDGVSSLLASYRNDGYGLGPSYENYRFGFRVSQVVPEPSSLIALAGGLISLLGIRLRRTAQGIAVPSPSEGEG